MFQGKVSNMFQAGLDYFGGGFKNVFKQSLSFLDKKFQTLSEAPGMFRDCFKEAVLGSCKLF